MCILLPGASPGRLLAAPVEPGAGADAVASSTAAGGATREDGGDKQAEEENVEDDEEYDPEAIAEMQAKLDQDLAEMFAQLQVRGGGREAGTMGWGPSIRPFLETS